MSFATLMVHVDLFDTSDARVRLAIDLSDRFNSVLIGIAACAPVPPPVENGFAEGQLVADQVRDIASRLERRGEQFRAVAGAHRSRIEWRSEIDFPVKVVAQEARAADLVIVGRDRVAGGPYQSLDPGSAILQMGRPVLVVPPGIESLPAERVVIGWKDTREARRALRDSLPVLREAKRVTIVEVCDEGMEEQARRSMDDVADYLTRHRIGVAARILAHTKGPAADELIRVGGEERADLIVAGAYGHSRLGEWIFGGVTRDLLTTCPVCCLLAH